MGHCASQAGAWLYPVAPVVGRAPYFGNSNAR
jgi:hypothetical protein